LATGYHFTGPIVLRPRVSPGLRINFITITKRLFLFLVSYSYSYSKQGCCISIAVKNKQKKWPSKEGHT
jgi:hypothetical protein